MKALVYRRGALGDTLLVFPLLEILSKKGYEVTAVGNTDYFRIAKEVGWAKRILDFVPEDEYDVEILISVDGNVSPFPQKRIWIVDHYLNSSGFKEDFSKKLPLSPLDRSPFEGKVVIHPSSGSPKKIPSPDLFLEVEKILKKEGLEVVYFAGEADSWVKETFDRVVESLDPLWIGKALKKAKAFIGLDSGISHLASYVGLPTVIFYGPTDPVVWRPIGERVFQICLSLECSPCFPNVCQERSCFRLEDLLEHFAKLLPSLRPHLRG